MATCVTETILVRLLSHSDPSKPLLISGELVRGGAAVFAVLLFANTTSYFDLYLAHASLDGKVFLLIEEKRDSVGMYARLVPFAYFALLAIAVWNEHAPQSMPPRDITLISICLMLIGALSALLVSLICLRHMLVAKSALFDSFTGTAA